VWDVPWSYRKAWVDWTLGYSTTLIGQNGNPFLTRSIPAQVPVPGYQHLYAAEVESTQLAGVMKPAGFVAYNGDGSLNPTAWAPWLAYQDPSTGKDGLIRYAVRYRPRPYEILDDAAVAAIANTQGELERFVEWVPKGAVQALPLPTGS